MKIAIISWLACGVVITLAWRAAPFPVEIGEALAIHAQFEAAIAHEELKR